jgi:hypothetical protein
LHERPLARILAPFQIFRYFWKFSFTHSRLSLVELQPEFQQFISDTWEKCPKKMGYITLKVWTQSILQSICSK